MTIKIKKKIIGYEIIDKKANKSEEMEQSDSMVDDESALEASTVKESETAEIIQMHEKLERPDVLLGSTYKIKTPQSEHALYITINDIVLNPGTRHEVRRPYEIFINSKNMDHFQWIVALTRIISAVFRKGGDVTFLVDELRNVFDPRGGYFKKGGKYKPSLVAEIGDAIECHMKMIGMIEDKELDLAQRKILEAKRKEYVRIHDVELEKTGQENTAIDTALDFPASAQLCKKCHTKAVISMDGCMTCLSCGDSKCS